MAQVTKQHYSFSSYLNLPRWYSYWNQIDECIKLKPNSVLIIGVGDNIVAKILSDNIAVVHTFDIDQTLNPTFCGNLLEIQNIISQRYDVILCCQVLEHLPYENFEAVLLQLSHLSKFLILSLPYCHHKLIDFNLSLLKYKFNINLSIPRFYKQWNFDGQHYWEIGCKGYGLKKINQSIQKFFHLNNRYQSRINSYHYFYILSPHKHSQ